MCFVDLEKAFDRVPRGVLWGVLWEYGVRGSLLRAVQSLYDRSRSCVSAVSQTCSRCMLDSARAALCHRFCSLYLWTEFLGVARSRGLVQGPEGSGSGTTGSHLCCLQMMLS
ncbi:hypothetical protein NQD34_006603 [Periophthalmus magnuspinnatus]|nr:hypothetical protein NQD34_006603 [Periophthalmus magnuspinnatus]